MHKHIGTTHRFFGLEHVCNDLEKMGFLRECNRALHLVSFEQKDTSMYQPTTTTFYGLEEEGTFLRCRFLRNLQSRQESGRSRFETLCPINVNLPFNDAKNLARHFSRLILGAELLQIDTRMGRYSMRNSKELCLMGV